MFQSLKKRLHRREISGSGNPNSHYYYNNNNNTNSTGSSNHVTNSSSTNSGGIPSHSSTTSSASRYMPQRFLSIAELSARVDTLSAFDSCVETADALASGHATNYSSSSQQQQQQEQEDEPMEPTNDTTSNPYYHSDLSNCSVLVSPDGNLLLAEQHENLQDPSSLSPVYSQLVKDNQGDYSSAIFFGDDLTNDVQRNGFSARGWSVLATHVGMVQTRQLAQTTLTWAEDLLRSKHEYLDNLCISCDEFQSPSNVARLPLPPPAPLLDMDPTASDYELTLRRVGPFSEQKSTLYRAMQAYISYCNNYAEAEKGALDKALNDYSIQVAKTSKVVRDRQEALDETVRRIRGVQDRVAQLQKAAKAKWDTVYAAEDRVSKKHGEILQKQSQRQERERLERMRSTSSGDKTPEDIPNVVHEVNQSLDFDDYDPMDYLDQHTDVEHTIDADIVSREALEEDARLPVLRQNAMNADDAVEDAAQGLLNLLSHYDTLRRSSRIATETSLLRVGQAQSTLLKRIVGTEKEELQRRLRQLEDVERSLDSINVREDLNNYITEDKKDRGGKSPLGDDDDGGIAAALATLTSHVEGFRDIESFGNGRSEESDDEISITNAQVDEALETVFAEDSRLMPSDADFEHAKARVESATDVLCEVGTSRAIGARARRATLCYKLNSKRNSNTHIPTKVQFDCLCRIFSSVLTGCAGEDGGVANAKMCIMLAQSFYFEDDEGVSAQPTEKLASSKERSKRIYIKNNLTNHELWTNDHFWDEALSLQVSESLAHSGVLSNFERSKRATGPDTTGRKQVKRMCWYDLNSHERIEAASQVQAVVFAQLSALAHSMLEFGCGLKRSCSFVRRMAIRHQLPTSQRAMLIKHLVDREKKEEHKN